MSRFFDDSFLSGEKLSSFFDRCCKNKLVYLAFTFSTCYNQNKEARKQGKCLRR